MTFAVRPANEADLDAIAAIQAESPEAAQWPARDYMAYESRVAVAGATTSGFVVWRTVAAAEYEILNLAVAPAMRRLGIATLLIRTALQSASGNWFLEVRESNSAARSLYKSMGFTEAGVRQKYYETPHESGIVMSFCS